MFSSKSNPFQLTWPHLDREEESEQDLLENQQKPGMSKRVTFCKAACSLNGSFKVSLLCDNVARSIRTIWPHNATRPNESQVNHAPQWGSFEWKQRRSPQDCSNWNIDVLSGLEIVLEKIQRKYFFIFSCMPLLFVHFKVTWTKLKGKFLYFFFISKFGQILLLNLILVF